MKSIRNGIITLAVFIALVLVVILTSQPSPKPEIKSPMNTWKTYTNETYRFSVQYPPDWAVFDGQGVDLTPKINIYKPGDASVSSPPYDHHSTDIAQVSFFPMGVPTEGVFGASATSSIQGANIKSATDFLLGNGNPWGTMILFKNPPASWREYGFAWLSVPLADVQTTCTRNGTEIPETGCDPLSGDTIIRNGSIDENLRNTEREIFSTFRFLPS